MKYIYIVTTPSNKLEYYAKLKKILSDYPHIKRGTVETYLSRKKQPYIKDGYKIERKLIIR